MSDLSVTRAALERSRSQLSVSSYFDAELFRREMGRIFDNSPRYLGHMLTDLLMPGLLGYMAGLLYNQNNITEEAGTITVQFEAEAVQLLARMLCLPETAWGHLCSGGTAANLEALCAETANGLLPVRAGAVSAMLDRVMAINPTAVPMLIALLLIAVATFLAFSKDIPFTTPYQLKARFENAPPIQKGQAVRIAGVDVGRVSGVESVGGDSPFFHSSIAPSSARAAKLSPRRS